MKKKTEALSLAELVKKRNELMLQLKLGKSKDTGGLVKIRREIARMKTR